METKEIINTTKSYEYVAIDGTIFKDRAECEKYEESAKMMLYSKYQPLVIHRKSEEELYGTGSCEYEIDIVKIKEHKDIDTLIQLYCLYNNRKNTEEVTNERSRLGQWWANQDTLFIGRGCAYDNYDCFYFIGTMENTIEHIKEQCING
jgi:hypothetical protein